MMERDKKNYLYFNLLENAPGVIPPYNEFAAALVTYKVTRTGFEHLKITAHRLYSHFEEVFPHLYSLNKEIRTGYSQLIYKTLVKLETVCPANDFKMEIVEMFNRGYKGNIKITQEMLETYMNRFYRENNVTYVTPIHQPHFTHLLKDVDFKGRQSELHWIIYFNFMKLCNRLKHEQTSAYSCLKFRDFVFNTMVYIDQKKITGLKTGEDGCDPITEEDQVSECLTFIQNFIIPRPDFKKEFSYLQETMSIKRQQKPSPPKRRKNLKGNVIPEIFRSLVRKATCDFVGRDHIFSAVKDFTEKEQGGYFFIKGTPGSGKTAFLAEYASRFQCFFYACGRKNDMQKQNRNFLTHVCYFLENICNSGNIPQPETLEKAEDYFLTLLEKTGSLLDKNKKLIITVDALDEIADISSMGTGNVLCLPRYLPDHVYFILTSRNIHVPLFVQAPWLDMEIDKYVKENQKDIQTYLTLMLNKNPGLAEWLATHNMKEKEFITIMVEKSELNFMYLYHMLPAIAVGNYDDLDLDNLPVGLENYYIDHWRRMQIRKDPLFDLKIRIIYILAESLFPLTVNQIAFYVDEKRTEVQSIIDHWIQFLRVYQGSNKQYEIYHKSFKDFLHKKETIQLAGIDLREMSLDIAEKLAGFLKEGE